MRRKGFVKFKYARQFGPQVCHALLHLQPSLSYITAPESVQVRGDTLAQQLAGTLLLCYQKRLSQDPVWLTERILFLGEIERKNDFEGKKPIGSLIKPEGEEPDYLYDDTALAYKSPQGLVIITGCSHSGICNIVEQAKKLCKEKRVIDIIGGLHLLDPSKEQLQGTLEYMKELNPKQVHACHCTDLNSKIALSKVVNLKEVGVGLVLEYE